jgi:hypothetical protein
MLNSVIVKNNLEFILKLKIFDEEIYCDILLAIENTYYNCDSRGQTSSSTKIRTYGERIDSGEDKILGDFTTEPTHAGNLKK